MSIGSFYFPTQQPPTPTPGSPGPVTGPSTQTGAGNAGATTGAGDVPPVGYQQAVQNLEQLLFPPGGTAASDPDASLEAMENALSSLPVAGEVLDFLARALVEQAASQRKDALNERLGAREMAKAQLNEQAGTMDKAADDLMKGAIASLVIAVVTAAVTIGLSVASAVVSGIGAGKAMSAGTQAATQVENEVTDGLQKGSEAAKNAIKDASKEIATASKDAAKEASRSWTSAGETLTASAGALKSVGDGGSGAANTLSQGEAKRQEAEGTRDAAEAQSTQAHGDMKKEMQQAMDEAIKQLIQFLKEIADAMADRMQVMTKV